MKVKIPLPKQEDLLSDYADRLKQHRKGRLAIHVRLSGLRPHNRRDHHLRLAAAHFAPLIRKYEGQFFRLTNADMVFIGKDVPKGELGDAAIKIRYMFRDDPFVERTEDPNCAETFERIFALQQDYVDFLNLVGYLRQACANYASVDPAALAEFAGDEKAPPARFPLNPRALGQLEQSLETLDLTTVLRKRHIYAIVDDLPPRPVLLKYFASLPALQRLLMPDYDLEADDWLAHRLRTSLEKRLMQDLMACDVSKALPVNIEMHTANVLSKAALPFLTEMKKKSGRAVLVETPSTDVFRDVSAFLFARDCLHTNGQKMAIAGLDPRIFTMFDRTAIQADVYKLRWTSELTDWLEDDGRKQLARAVESVGAPHLVLSRCTDAASVEAGAAAGLRLFEGPYIDHLATTNSRPLAVNG
jgi:hypothetical protein